MLFVENPYVAFPMFSTTHAADHHHYFKQQIVSSYNCIYYSGILLFFYCIILSDLFSFLSIFSSVILFFQLINECYYLKAFQILHIVTKLYS